MVYNHFKENTLHYAYRADSACFAPPQPTAGKPLVPKTQPLAPFGFYLLRGRLDCKQLSAWGLRVWFLQQNLLPAGCERFDELRRNPGGILRFFVTSRYLRWLFIPRKQPFIPLSW